MPNANNLLSNRLDKLVREVRENEEFYGSLQRVMEVVEQWERVQLESMMVRYTDAPEAYDGFGTKCLIRDAGMTPNGKRSFRKVAIHPQHVVWQVQRYQSGGYIAPSQGQLEDFGWALHPEYDNG